MRIQSEFWREQKRLSQAMRMSFLSKAAFWLCISLLFQASLPAAPVSAQTNTSVSVQPVSSLMYSSCADVYRIMVNNVTNLYAFDVIINFDPAILQVLDMNSSVDGIQVRQGSFLENGYMILNKVDNTTGTVRFAATQVNPQTPKSGSGVLLEILFTGMAQGISPITIVNPQLAISDGTLAPVNIIDGSLQVNAYSAGDVCPVTVTPTLTSTITPLVSNTPIVFHRKTKTPTPVFTPRSTATPNPSATALIVPSQTVTQTPQPSATRTTVPIPVKPNPTQMACKPAPTPIVCAPTSQDPFEAIVGSLSDGRYLIYICPAGLLFLILGLLLFLYFGRNSEPEESSEYNDYEI